MRSKPSAITARTPSRRVPRAAQSRDDPVPYSAPPMTIIGVPSASYSFAASYVLIVVPSGMCFVNQPSVGATSSFFTRGFANVPRIITS